MVHALVIVSLYLPYSPFSVTISIDQITSELTRCGLTNYQVGGESPTSIITAAVTKIEGRYEANMWSVFDWTDSTSIYSSKEFQDTLSNLIQAKDQAGPVTVTKLLQVCLQIIDYGYSNGIF